MLRLAAILVFLASSIETGPLQEPATEPTAPACNFAEIYKADGWSIPGLQNAKIKQKANFVNLPGVVVTKLEPSVTEATLTQISCSREHPGRIEIEEKPIGILELTAYEYKGRVFAYGLYYEGQAIEDSARVRLGCASSYLFYDVEGSGHFTLRNGRHGPSSRKYQRHGRRRVRGELTLPRRFQKNTSPSGWFLQPSNTSSNTSKVLGNGIRGEVESGRRTCP